MLETLPEGECGAEPPITMYIPSAQHVLYSARCALHCSSVSIGAQAFRVKTSIDTFVLAVDDVDASHEGDDDESDDDNDDDMMSTDAESGNDTITSLVSVGDDKDCVDQSYTSAEEKGGKLSSREIAINTIIEQSKNGAEWFEFNLPSDSEDDNGEDDTSDDDDVLGMDPADIAALNAIASSRSLTL